MKRVLWLQVYGAFQPGKDYLLVHAPFALAPVPFPEKAFLDAKSAATAYNAMIDSVSQDGEYLTNVLRLAAQYDEFTVRCTYQCSFTRVIYFKDYQVILILKQNIALMQKSLLDIHKDILDGTLPLLGQSPQLSLLISRSDYMLHAPTSAMLQVELNTIASSFGCLSSLVSKLHRYILGRAGVSEEDIDAQLPKNVSMEAIVDGLAAAVNEHGHKNKVMMMVVQPGEQNSFDQQWLQLNLWNRYKIKTLRRTLADVCSRAIVDPETGHLVIDGNTVSLAYFRAGYTPMDYPTEKEWEARRIIEQSSAAKCPTVAMQLAGSKKVQQDLARPGVLEKFSRTEEEAQMMRRSFAGLWSLDDIASDADASAAVQDAIQNPDLYVLKPQREGGGNNIYGKDLADRLSSGQGLSAFILMQRILPPPHTVTMIRNGEAQVTESLSELGVYGALLRRDENILSNHEAGHLVRTKASSSSEGGVAAGFAVLDSPRLI